MAEPAAQPSSPIFKPKLFTVLRGYSRVQFIADAIAGLTVGVVALPLALAFGIASIPEHVAREAGLSPPAMGLFTAIIAGFVISFFGGSRVAIGGPTGAFVVIVYAIADQHGYDGLFYATVLAGVMLVAMGVARLGTLIKFIPYPVTTGFTTGIAVIILTSQIKDLLGLGMHADAIPVPPDFVGKVRWCSSHLDTINWHATALGVAMVIGLFLWKRVMPRRVPGPIFLLIGVTVVAQVFHLDAQTIGDRFGAIPSSLPMPHLPKLDYAGLKDLVGPAGTIAMLAAIESLLCCVVADGMLGTRHRSNTELVAQGLANIAAPLFGGIPATGAIARTATNVQAGGRTPVAGIIHAGVLAVIMVTVAQYAELIPLSALAGILVVVAWNMSELHRFRWLLNGPKQDTLVLLATFGLTVFTDLTIAVGVGMVLAAILFMKRMADVANVTTVGLGGAPRDATTAEVRAHDAMIPPGVAVYAINGPFFFGAAYKLRETLDGIGSRPHTLIIDVSNVMSVDATGLHALEEMLHASRARGTRVILAGVHKRPMFAIATKGILDRLGDENLAADVETALEMMPGRETSG